jgi:hypothetical protein
MKLDRIKCFFIVLSATYFTTTDFPENPGIRLISVYKAVFQMKLMHTRGRFLYVKMEYSASVKIRICFRQC